MGPRVACRMVPLKIPCDTRICTRICTGQDRPGGHRAAGGRAAGGASGSGHHLRGQVHAAVPGTLQGARGCTATRLAGDRSSGDFLNCIQNATVKEVVNGHHAFFKGCACRTPLHAVTVSDAMNDASQLHHFAKLCHHLLSHRQCFRRPICRKASRARPSTVATLARSQNQQTCMALLYIDCCAYLRSR